VQPAASPPPRVTIKSAWSRFVATFGWRAYAVACLLVLTVIVIVKPGTAAGSESRSAQPAAAGVASTTPTNAPAPPSAAATSNSAASEPAVTAAPQVIADKVDSTPCQTNSATQLVLVNLSQQRAWMCQGHQQVNSTSVTTGNVKAGEATPVGSWHVQAKQANRYLSGPGYSDFVKFWIPFNGDFGFHDASWQTFPFGSPLYKSAGSNGCVHLPTPTMAWFYSWVQDGALVTVQA
jgi:lipoprotein-anchoring transpeptidase ErfK/SrfK